MLYFRSVLRLSVFLLPLATCPAADWPQWRGPGGQGHAEASNLPVSWSETNNVAWKTSIPGQGWSSPVIEGNQIWLTTAIDTPANPESIQTRLKSNSGGQPLTLSDQVSLRAICADKTSGKIVHNIELLQQQEPQWVHRLNSYASPTPLIENGRLYCHFGTYGTVCLDTRAGKIAWTNHDLRIMHENGPGSSPILWGQFLIVHCDGSDQQYIAALDKTSGRLAWKTQRSGKMHDNPQMKKSYGTPLITDVNGAAQLLSPAADWLYAYDPATGQELWKLSYGALGFSIVPRPVVGHGLLYMSTSFMRPQILAIRIDSAAQPEIAWRINRGAPNIASPLLVDHELYFVSDSGIATCVDAVSGDELWRERLGGDFASSPLYADGKVYFLGRNGTTTVIQPGREFHLISKNELAGTLMASPAAVGNALFIRTEKALYRIEKKPG